MLRPIETYIYFYTKRNYKVAICGASGKTAQLLALQLRRNEFVTNLTLYDVKPVTKRIATDLSYVQSYGDIVGCFEYSNIGCALGGANIIVIPACDTNTRPNMSKECLLKENVQAIMSFSFAVAKYNPCAMIVLMTDPLSVLMPIFCQILRKKGRFNRSRVFGLTTLNTLRAQELVAAVNKTESQNQYVPVIGGNDGQTIVPLLSQCYPVFNGDEKDAKEITEKIQGAGAEVLKLKNCKEPATLSAAFAAERFVTSLLRGLMGQKNIVECAYVSSEVTEAPYFASPLLLGPSGIKKYLPLGKMNEFEKTLLDSAICELQKDIQAGEIFVEDNYDMILSCITA